MEGPSPSTEGTRSFVPPMTQFYDLLLCWNLLSSCHCPVGKCRIWLQPCSSNLFSISGPLWCLPCFWAQFFLFGFSLFKSIAAVCTREDFLCHLTRILRLWKWVFYTAILSRWINVQGILKDSPWIKKDLGVAFLMAFTASYHPLTAKARTGSNAGKTSALFQSCWGSLHTVLKNNNEVPGEKALPASGIIMLLLGDKNTVNHNWHFPLPTGLRMLTVQLVTHMYQNISQPFQCSSVFNLFPTLIWLFLKTEV